jgi:hypothetical protein
VKRVLFLALVASLAAGCGGTTHTKTTAAHKLNPNCASRPITTAQKRAYRRLGGILAQMRRATTHAAESRLTDRFLLAEGTSGLSAYVRNRLLDHAIAYATPKCQDCFQALEAARPIARPCSSS